MEKNKKSPEQELVESIGLMIDKGLESTTDVYTGVVKSVDGKRAIVSINGRNQNVAISSAAVASGNVVRVFVPRGNMSAAFIVKAESNGGGGTTTTAYGDLTGKPKINGVTLVDNKTSKELNLYGTGNAPPYPVTSVNGKTGDVTISAGGNVDSVNGKTGAVVLTQDDIGNGTTYVRTHNDFTDALKTQINTNEDNIAMAESDIDGLQTDVGTLKTNVGNIQTALTSKQDVVVGAASTITENNLTINRALVSNSSGKVAVSNVTSTELGYLDGVTSNVQTQLNNKLENIPIATSTTLGGVKPVAKTDDMTQQVGVDENGKLYTSPGSGGGSGAVTSVNGKTGDVELTASDVGALPSDTTIPTPFYAGFGVHGEDTYDENPTHGVVTTYENILEAYNSGKPCYAKIKIIGTEYTQTMIAPLAYVDTAYEEVGFALTKMTQGDTPEELIICYATINGSGEAEAYVGSRYTGSSINNFLPSVSTSDNGKFLRVINGAWAAVAIADANGGSF